MAPLFKKDKEKLLVEGAFLSEQERKKGDMRDQPRVPGLYFTQTGNKPGGRNEQYFIAPA